MIRFVRRIEVPIVMIVLVVARTGNPKCTRPHAVARRAAQGDGQAIGRRGTVETSYLAKSA
ncbi:hypothetical protein MB901379_01534 [Mycobacterium basiliense]|uniref:Uncharacterized protein n=1 Tax=Mycobacterium basiliense TaxID=2094119 RepID=A0A447GBW4_9MYCO|nr:hypothetical protein MB901379_01534 [Mycobacterium basiliense]